MQYNNLSKVNFWPGNWYTSLRQWFHFQEKWFSAGGGGGRAEGVSWVLEMEGKFPDLFFRSKEK